MSNFIIPLIIVVLIIFAFYKRRNVYADFILGAQEALTLVFDLFAYIIAIFILVEILNESGLTQVLTNLFKPIFSVLGIPHELTKLVLIKPFSGSGSLAVLQEIFTDFGADSYIGRCASVILGSSETVFYVSSVYFSKSKIKKIGIAVPIALICMFISVVLSCLICRII